MFVFLIALIAGAALVLFIIWEDIRPERPLSRKAMEAGFEPGASSKVTALFVLGAAGIYLGLYLFANPEHPPFTGSRVFTSSVLYALFGPYGIPAFIMAFSVAAIVGGFVVKRSRSRQRRKSNVG